MLLLRTLFVSVGLLALAACAGTTEQQASTPKSTSSVAVAETPATTETAASGGEMVERRICKRIHVTGTRFPKKVCMTKQEWKEASEQAQEDLNRSIMDSQATVSDE